MGTQSGRNLGAKPQVWPFPHQGFATTSAPALGTHPSGRGVFGRPAALQPLLGGNTPSGGLRLAVHPEDTPAQSSP